MKRRATGLRKEITLLKKDYANAVVYNISEWIIFIRLSTLNIIITAIIIIIIKM